MENIIDLFAYLGFIIAYKVGNLKYRTLYMCNSKGKKTKQITLLFERGNLNEYLDTLQ